MGNDFEELCNSLSMTDIIRLQTMLSTALVRRFERPLSLVFSDVVESTKYFARFGDAAGRQLQQRHIDLLQQTLSNTSGRIVDTAGDGAFLCFKTVDETVSSMVELLRLISVENFSRSREQQLAVRIGIHFGPALTDGVQVAGDAVNFCSRVSASANPGEIRLSRDAFLALTQLEHRLKCHPLPPAILKGFDKPAALMILDWREAGAFPDSIVLDTGQQYKLPDQDIVTFGRLREQGGVPANDIVLECSEDSKSMQISRWHFELRRRSDGYVLRSVTATPTDLNGRSIAKGEESPVRPGDSVCVGNVLSIVFKAAAPALQPTVSAGETVVYTKLDAAKAAAPTPPPEGTGQLDTLQMPASPTVLK
jgi:class 3 adenylate cyclase